MTFSKLGTDIQTGAIVELPQASRRQGLYIIGANGTGKTGLIENLILQDINQGLGVGLLDPHGDLTNAILAKMTKRLDDVLLLDIAEYNFPFGLNLFTCSDPTNLKLVSEAASKVMHVFKKLWGKGGIIVEDAWGVLLEEILRNATMTFLECSQHESYTMAEIPLLLENDAFRNHLVQKLMFRNVKNYWLNKYNRLSDKDQLDERRSTLNRINAFLTQPLVENIVGQAKTTIDFRRIMDERKILLVMLDRRMADITSLIGSIIIAEFLDAAYSRTSMPIDKRKQFNLYADEFQLFATEDFAILLTEARKFGIATTIAHQIRDQLDLQNRSATLNVGNLVVFKVSGKDAEELAGSFDTTPPPPPQEEVGRREKLTIEHNICDYLLHNTHTNEWIEQFVIRYLRAMYEAAKHPNNYQEEFKFMPYVNHPIPAWEKLPEIQWKNYVKYSSTDELPSLLDTFFYEILNDPTYDFPLPVTYGPLRLSVLGDWDYWFKYTNYWEINLGSAPLFGFTDYVALITEPSEIVALFIKILNVKRKIYKDPTYMYNGVWESGPLFDAARPKLDKFTDELRKKGYKGTTILSPNIIDWQKRLFEAFNEYLYCVITVLREKPPMSTKSGGFEIIYRPGNVRTYQDMQNEIASRIANQPNFTARVKITTASETVEHTVKTLSPEQGLGRTALEQRKAAIKAQNLAQGYYRLRQEVEAEISQRQAGWGGSTPAQKQSPHARQVPIQGKCSNCGASNSPGAKFCNQCGGKL